MRSLTTPTARVARTGRGTSLRCMAKRGELITTIETPPSAPPVRCHP